MEYKTPDKSDFDAIRAIIGDDNRVLTGEAIGEDYSHDEMGGVHATPDIVVRAVSADEIARVMSYACNNGIPVTPRGAGTGLVGACVPVERGIIIETTLMNHILELDEKNLTVTVEPGVLLMELAAYVQERGYFYPPDPGEKTATIGGNISTNAGGMRAVKYGLTRDYVRGLEVVLPTGKTVHMGGKVVKNSSGYALKDLIIGSEGTLGIVTKAILKLLPLPKETVSLLVPFGTIREAIDAVPPLLKLPASPAAIEFMERDVIMDAERHLGTQFPDNSSDAYLLLSFDGAEMEELERDYTAAVELVLELGAIDVLVADTRARRESIWKMRDVFLEAIKSSTTEMDEVDVVVPRDRVSELLEYIYEVQKLAGLRLKSFGHAGDGNLHVYLLRDALESAEWAEKMAHAMQLIYAKAHDLGGQVSGEHGIGYAKKPYLEQSLDPELLVLMAGIKRVFDPKNILNPSKVFDI